jgi:hypothetical protein
LGEAEASRAVGEAEASRAVGEAAMRSLTPTLEAAQRGGTQQPRVRCLVRDRQARFAYIGAQAFPEVQNDLCLCSDGETVIVVALDTAGVIRCRKVTDPTYLNPSGEAGLGWGWWSGDWTPICSDALGWDKGDVAISLNSSTLRMFYVKADGSAVLCRESTDDGEAWGAAVTVKSLSGASPTYEHRLCSAGNEDVFWCRNRSGDRYVYFRKYAGGWGSEQSLAAMYRTGGEFSACGGLSAIYNSTGGYYELVAAFWDLPDNSMGHLRTCEFTDGSGVANARTIVPPGVATPGFTPLWPCLYAVPAGLGGGYLLTYSDVYSASELSWSHPVCLRSRDFEHWSYKIPLAFDVTHVKRWCMVDVSAVVYVYAVNEAYSLQLYSAGDSEMELEIAHARILRYRIHERPGAGQLWLEVDNRDGAYDDPGVDGVAAEAMRPLAQVIVDQGLLTAAGEERVECRPFLLWDTSMLRDWDKNWLRLHAVDGWQLFKLWRPDATYVFEGQTLRWCIEELAARVGYFECQFDGSDEWDMSVEYLAVAGSHTDWSGRQHIRAWDRWIPLDDVTVAFDDRVNGYNVLMQLLGLVGGVARWGNGTGQEHVLYCFIPHNQGESPAADHTYNDGEILSGQYVKGIAWPTRVRATGNGVAYEGEDTANALALGMELVQFLYQENWPSADECQMAVNSALDDAEARARGGWFRARPNVGLELFDVVVFTDSKAGAGLASIKRRVNGLLTTWDPLKKVWEQTVYLEQV